MSLAGLPARPLWEVFIFGLMFEQWLRGWDLRILSIYASRSLGVMELVCGLEKIFSRRVGCGCLPFRLLRKNGGLPLRGLGEHSRI